MMYTSLLQDLRMVWYPHLHQFSGQAIPDISTRIDLEIPTWSAITPSML
jgi:hypothetical protein